MHNDNDDITRYRNNQMSEKERNAFERRALNDPFLHDALEGSESVDGGEFSKDVRMLSENVKGSGATSWKIPLRIAAGIAIIITAGWLVLRTGITEPKTLALQKGDSTTVPVRDTIKPLITMAKPQDEPIKPADVSKATTPKKETSRPDATSSSIATDDAAKAGAGVSAQPATSATTPAIGPTPTEVTLPVAERKEAEATNRSEGVASPSRMKLAAPMSAQDIALEEKRKDDSQRSEIVIQPPTIEKEKAGGSITLAAPVGGIVAYQRYLESNQQMPRAAQLAGIQGNVIVSFIVLPEGKLSDITTVKSLGFGCDEEVIRLIKDGPAWSPSAYSLKLYATTIIITLKFPAR